MPFRTKPPRYEVYYSGSSIPEGVATEATLQEIKAQTDRLHFDADSDLYVAGRVKEGAVDFTTSDTLSDAIVIDTSSFNKITIMMKNTGDTNSADIEIYTKANTNGQIEYKEYSVTLVPGDVAKAQLNGKYSEVVVRARSSVSGSPTTIRIEWIGGK